MVNIVEHMKRFKDKVKLEVPRPRTEIRVCHKCGKVGHIWSRYSLVKRENQGANFVFAIGNGVDAHANHWILDSGSSRHLVNDPSLLTNPTLGKSECLTAATDVSVVSPSKKMWTSKSPHLAWGILYESSMFSTPKTSSVTSYHMGCLRQSYTSLNIETGDV